MINVKQAVAVGVEYVRDMYKDEMPSDIRVEEVRVSNDGNDWLITIGFSILEARTGNQLSALNMLRQLVRKFKELQIDRQSGEVKSMTIRQLLGYAS